MKYYLDILHDFSYYFFEILCVFYIYNPSHFALATLQVFYCYIWLVDTLLGGRGLSSPIFTESNNVLYISSVDITISVF